MGLKVFIALAFGPLLAVVSVIAIYMLLQWGADCESVRGTLECRELFGLWNVNAEKLSFVGAGYALGIAALWASLGLAILFLVGITILIFEFWRSAS